MVKVACDDMCVLTSFVVRRRDAAERFRVHERQVLL